MVSSCFWFQTKRVQNNVTRKILFLKKKIFLFYNNFTFFKSQFIMSSLIELSDIEEYNAEDFADFVEISNKNKVIMCEII